MKKLLNLFGLFLLFSFSSYATTNLAEEANSSYCKTVRVVGKKGKINVTGIQGTWQRISYLSSNNTSFIESCSDNCGTSYTIPNLPAGTYRVRVEQSDGGYTNYCIIELGVQVQAARVNYCGNVNAIGKEGRIRVNNVNAPWSKISYTLADGTTSYDVCNDNCTVPQIIPSLASGQYVVRVEQSDLDGSNACVVELVANVTSPPVDYCNNVRVVGKEGRIRVNNVNAPWQRIRYRLAGTSGYSLVCKENCTHPQIIRNLAAGTYEVEVRQSDLDRSINFCSETYTAVVTSTTPPVDYCAGVTAVGGVETISISGVNAPWRSIKYRPANSSSYTTICTENCANPQTLAGVPAGAYVITVEQSDGSNNFCTVDIPVTVAAPAIDYCAGVAAVGGVETITVSGVNAPWSSIKYRFANGIAYTTLCTENCSNQTTFTGVQPDSYIITIEQSDGSNNFCTVDIPVTVAAPAIDYCAGVTAVGGVETISISGVNAPWRSIKYRPANGASYTTICTENCTNPQPIADIPAGAYIITVAQSDGSSNYCTVDIPVTVTAPAIDYCSGVTAVGGVETISISGVNAPWRSIKYRPVNGASYTTICTENCTNPQPITNIPAGAYIITVAQSDGSSNYCTVDIPVTVTAPAIDYCSGVTAVGGVETISISGVNAPWRSIKYRPVNGASYTTICTENCTNPQPITNIPAGAYIITVAQSDGSSNYCTVDIPVTVTAPAIDYCSGVTAVSGAGTITVSGVNAPWRSIKYRFANGSAYTTLCTENCGDPTTFTGIQPGSYVLKIEQSAGGNNSFCTVEIPVVVAAPRVDYCAGVTAAGGVGTIVVNGVNAPWRSIKFRFASGSIYTPLCTENCGNPTTFTNVRPGSYVLKIEQSAGGNNSYCTVEIPVTVTSASVDYCAGVSASGGVNTISISGITAPWSSVKYRYANGSSYANICSENCNSSFNLTGVAAGSYVLKIEQSAGGSNSYCTIEIPVTVSSPTTSSHCSNVVISPGAHKIVVVGVDAPWHRVIINGPSTNYKWWEACNETCAGNGNGITIKNLVAGYYTVVTEESGGSSEACQITKKVYVSGSGIADPVADSRSAAPASPSVLVNPEIAITIEEALASEVGEEIDFNTLATPNSTPMMNSEAIALFPNPAQDELNIDLQAFAGKDATLLIINQVGTVVKNLTLEELTASPVKVDVSHQASGIYFLRASIDGSEVVTKKFMISKR